VKDLYIYFVVERFIYHASDLYTLTTKISGPCTSPTKIVKDNKTTNKNFIIYCNIPTLPLYSMIIAIVVEIIQNCFAATAL